MAAFRHTHASGRFTATPQQEEAALDDYMAYSDLITVTEVDANLRARCLREPGWLAIFGNKGARDDCGLAILKDRFDLLEGDTRQLSPLRYMTERHVLSEPTAGAYAVVKDRKDGTVGVVVVVHMPHNMQAQLQAGDYRTDVARAYRDILRGARRLANGLSHTYHADWTMIVGDWNLNIKHVWVDLFLRAHFPSYRVNFTKPYPVRGTWGPLIMDLAMLRGVHVRGHNPKILPHEPGFDHVAWRQVLA